MSESVLLLGNGLPSLTAARSLAASGYRVIAGNGGEYDLLSRSRSCHEVWEHPPLTEPEALLTALTSLAADRPDIKVIVPILPPYVALLAAERARVPTGLAVASPSPEVVQTCIDKPALYGIADRIGVPTSPWGVASDLEELYAVADEVGYPCVIRPTRDAAGLMPGARKAAICRDGAELRAAFPAWLPGHEGLLVQREHPGLKDNITFIAQAGQLRALIRFRVTRTDNTDGTGFGVEVISMAPKAELTRHVEALVEALDYTGTGSAQFLVPDDRRPSLLEINPRLGLSTAYTRGLGLDVPGAAVQIARDTGAWHPPAGWSYRVGRRTVWTSRDLYGLRMSLARGQIGYRGAARWLGQTAKSTVGAHQHMSFDRHDPMPTIGIYTNLARVLLRPPEP